MEELISLTGPVERVAGKLVLIIPLDAGGDKLHSVCKQISLLDGPNLIITIPDWLAGTLRIDEGSLVSVDNRNGKLNITPVNPQPIQ